MNELDTTVVSHKRIGITGIMLVVSDKIVPFIFVHHQMAITYKESKSFSKGQ